MKKILFVQLPPPRLDFGEAPFNIPLAAGFMVSALKYGLSGDRPPETDFNFRILDRTKTDVLGDQGLISSIKEEAPHVLCMTLYVWNVQRSLFIASILKRELTNLVTLVGGPEVTTDNKWVLEHPAVDSGVFGEGESRIFSALHKLINGQGLAGIPGAFYKDGKNISINLASPEPWDLDRCPYPYLKGILSPSHYGTAFVETARGCPFKCKYCFYHKSLTGIRFHCPDRLKALFESLYSDSGQVSEIYLMDPTFNARPDFRAILTLLRNLRNSKDIKLHTELRSDLLSEHDIKLFREAGLSSAEIGLQSTNLKALEAAGRTGNPWNVIYGARKLKESGTEVTTGIILGLPGDSPSGFSKTMRDLKKSGAYSVIHPFTLSVLPGTDFRSQAKSLGLRFHDRPPYYIYQTNTFTRESLKDCLLEFEAEFETELDHINPPSMVCDSDSIVRSIDAENYISKWIVNTAARPSVQLAQSIAMKSTDPFTIWFKGALQGQVAGWACETMKIFCDLNPYTSLHIVTESDCPPDVQIIDELTDIIAQPDLYLNRAYQPLYDEAEIVAPFFWIIVPMPARTTEREAVMDTYSSRARMVWYVNDIDVLSMRQTAAPLLVRTRKNINIQKLNRLFSLLKQDHENCLEEILFARANHQTLWESKVRGLIAKNRIIEKILIT